MKKYILAVSLIFSFLLFFGVKNVDASTFCSSNTKVKNCISCITFANGHKGICMSRAWPQGDGTWKEVSCIYHGSNVCSDGSIIKKPFSVSVSESIASPVPKLHATIPNQYIFRAFNLINGLLPATDSVTVGHLNPPLQKDIYGQTILDVPESINADGTVSATFGNGLLGSIIYPGVANNNSNIAVWPPESIFDNLFSSLGTIDSTFQSFVSGAFNSNYGGFSSAISPKWYPMMVSNLPNPVSKIPLTPITINWPEVPGAVSYRFKLLVGENPLGIDTNLPQPINMVTTTRTYTFSGRGDVTYYWIAIPLDAAGNEISAPITIKNPIPIFIQPTQTSPAQFGYKWVTIPGAVRYEIQYALSFDNIPESLPFTNLASFPETTDAGTSTNTTTYVISSGLNANNSDSITGFHQFDFANSILASVQNNTGLSYPSLHWRIRGIDIDGNPIRENIAPRGIVEGPLPETPYQSGFPVWSRVTGATGYVVDVAENIADFDKLPKLTAAEVPVLVLSKGAGSTTTVATPSNPFLLRRIVADGVYEAGKFAVDRFKVLLKQPRVYMGDVMEANGTYEDLMVNNNYDYRTEFEANTEAWLADSASTNFGTDTLDTYYPTMFGILGINFVTTTNPNELKFTTNTAITIQNKSTGNALLTVTQSTDKKTTTLTFGVKSATGSGGSYAFKITGQLYSTFDGSTNNPLSFATVGPLPVLGNLAGKAATEFKELLPGTQYYYRVRAFKDPNPQLANTGANAFTFYPWSTPATITTETGVPSSITIGSDGLIFESPIKLSGLISKIDVPVITSTSASGGKSMITTGSVSQTLTWAPVPTATSYNVNVYDSTGKLFNSYSGITTTTFNVPGLKASSSYTYTLSSANASSKSLESQPYSFVTTSSVANNALLSAALKKNQDRVAAHKALLKAYNDLVAARTKANVTAKTALKKASSSLQSAAKVYTSRRIDIQVVPTVTR